MKRFFTLIEMLTVIVILGILAAIVVPNVKDMQKDAITSQLKSNIKILQTAVDTYSLKHDGDLPSAIAPTVNQPQFIDIDRLYPDYIKKKPDYDRVKDQKYWVDMHGKVWGATVDSPTELLQTDSNLEFNQQKKVHEYKLYQVFDNQISGKAFNGNVKELMTFPAIQNVDRLKVTLPKGEYLVSSVDTYGLESAPAGLNYPGYQDWFQPLLKKEGTFEFELDSAETMYWDDFQSVQETPEGTSIRFTFSVLKEDGSFTPYSEDFYSLIPSTHLKVKIEMKGANGLLPSLYDLRVRYHYAPSEKVTTSTRIQEVNVKDKRTYNTGESTIVVDEFVLPKKLKEIHNTDFYSPFFEPMVSYYVKKNEEFVPLTSYSDAGAGSVIRVKREYPQGDILVGTPSVLVSDQMVIQTVKPKSDAKPPEIVIGEEWEMVGTMRFFAHAGDGQVTDWISADIKEVKPIDTDILYRYSYSNSNQLNDWKGNYEEISQVPDSRSVRVSAFLLVKKDKVSTATPPSVTSVKITHARGVSTAVPQDNTSTEVGTGTPAWDIADMGTMYDGNDTTFYNMPWTTKYINWQGDITNKTLRILTEQYNTSSGQFQFLDRYNRPLYTVESGKNEKNYFFSIRGKQELKLRVPPGAVKMSVTAYKGDSGFIHIHEVQVLEGNPDSISAIQHVATDSSITLTWESPKTADHKYVAIFDNNVLVGTSTSNTFAHKPLISDTQHNYLLVPISDKGVVGFDSYYIANVAKRDIKWSGMNALVFDRDYSNSINLGTMAYEAKWEGPLSGRTVHMKISQSSYYYPFVSLLDSNRNAISTVDGGNNQIGTTFRPFGLSDMYLKVPDTAASLQVSVASSGGGSVKLYEVEDIPNPNLSVSNTSYTSDERSITLKWDNPNKDNFKHVAIFKNNTYLGSSTNGTFTDTPLYGGTTHTYSLYPIATNNAIGDLATVTAKVQDRPSGIVWNGLDIKSFDYDLNTGYSLPSSGGILTWTGDLTGKVVTIHSKQSSYWYGGITVLDKNGTAIPFTDPTGQITYNSLSTPSTKSDIKFKVPAGATKIKFSVAQGGGGSVVIYEVSEQ